MDIKLWLRDFIPATFSGARVMSYGYDAAFALSSSVSSVDTAATSLLDLIHGARQKPQEKRRPIIFIAHSLGGIIVRRVSRLQGRFPLPPFHIVANTYNASGDYYCTRAL
jgi:hypothetical protein